MSLTDRLKDVRRLAKPVRSRDEFKERYLDGLMQTPGLRGYFFDGDVRKDDPDTNDRYNELVRMVDAAYDQYGAKNFEHKGLLTRLIAKPLRKLGVAAALASHYYLNVYQSPQAYAVFIVPALGMMLGADVIEGLSYLYHNHEGYDLLRVPKIVLEGLLEKGLAVIPGYVTTIPEATLGDTKFERPIANKIMYKAQNEFIKKFGEYKVPKNVPDVIQFPIQEATNDKYKGNIVQFPGRQELRKTGS